MIVCEKGKAVVTSGDFKEQNFGVDSSGLPEIFEILRSLYPNPILALVREYACNGYDSQVFKGNPEVPLQVCLPTKLDAHLKIRDFGVGLSEEEMFDTYAYYGKSGHGKTESNKVIGGFGIGAKSFGCYTDVMTVESYQNGLRSVYTCYLDESRIGKLAKVSTFETEEPDGVKIIIGINERDFQAVYRSASFLFKHWNVEPEIRSAVIEYKNALINNSDLDRVILKGDDWKFTNNRTAYAVMGQVPYVIDKSAFPIDELSEEEKGLVEVLSFGTLAYFDIGELDIAPSRESLKMTDKTKNVLLARFKKISKFILDSFSEDLHKCKNIFEAKRFYDEKISRGEYFKFKKILTPLMWDGRKITSHYFLFGRREGVEVYRYNMNLNGIVEDPTLDHKHVHDFIVVSATKIYFNDTETVRPPKSRVRTVLINKTSADYAYIVNDITGTNKSYDSLIARWGLKEGEYEFLSNIEKTSRKREGAIKVDGENVYSKAYQFNPYYMGSRPKGYWDGVKTNLKKGCGIYVPISYFKPVNNGPLLRSNEEIVRVLEYLRQFNCKINVHGVRPKDVKKLGPRWFSLKQFLDHKVEKLRMKHNYQENLEKVILKDNLDKLINEKQIPSVQLLRAYHRKLLDENGLAFEVAEALVDCGKARSPLKGFIETIGKATDYSSIIKKARNSDIYSKTKNLIIRYPLLKIVPNYTSNYTIEEFAEYLNLVDKKS